MKNELIRASARLVALAAVFAVAQNVVRAELIVGLTSQNTLISFDSATPGTVSVPIGLSGILAGDTLIGIDRRPSTNLLDGTLYSLGVNLSSGLGGVDTCRTPDVLALHENPNGGTLQTQMALPEDSNGALTGYDISGLTGKPYFSVTVGNSSSSFYMGTTLVGTIGGGVSVMDIAAPVGNAAPEPAGLLLSAAGLFALAVWRRRRQ